VCLGASGRGFITWYLGGRSADGRIGARVVGLLRRGSDPAAEVRRRADDERTLSPTLS
jgi:hypothetical protein